MRTVIRSKKKENLNAVRSNMKSLKFKETESATDEDLIRDYVNNNNERAFNSIIKKYENIIYGLAYRMLGNHSLCEEVMQEVFLILARKLSTFREDAKFSTWVYRVVVNMCLMYKRSEFKHRGSVSLDQQIDNENGGKYIDYIQDSRVASPYEQSSSSQIMELVERELQKLPKKYRVAFILRDVDGLTNPEVAEILGISVAAVKSRILRARRFLKSRLGYKLQYES